MKSIFYILFIYLISMTACYNDSEENLYPNPSACDTVNVSYKTDVSPILENRCYNCHANNTTNSIYEFEGHSDLLAIIATRNFLGAIKREAGVLAMPLGGDKIPDCEISIIEAWITQGKLNN